MLHPTHTQFFFSASDMILHISSDGYYLSDSKSRSRVGGIFYLSSKLPQHNQAPDCNYPFNATFHVVAKILTMITSSAMETEVAATFYNAKEALPFRVTLAEMGHPPTTYSYVGGQWNSDWLPQKHKEAKEEQINWYEILLGQRQGESIPIFDPLLFHCDFEEVNRCFIVHLHRSRWLGVAHFF